MYDFAADRTLPKPELYRELVAAVRARPAPRKARADQPPASDKRVRQ